MHRAAGTRNLRHCGATSPVVLRMWRKLDWCVVDWRRGGSGEYVAVAPRRWGDCGGPRRGGCVHTCGTVGEGDSGLDCARLRMSRAKRFGLWFALVCLVWQCRRSRQCLLLVLRWGSYLAGRNRYGTDTDDQRGATVPVVVRMWRKLDWVVVDWR